MTIGGGSDGSGGKRIVSEVKLLVEYCVSDVCCFHVLGRARDGDVEVEVEGEDGTGDEDDEDGEGRVFKVSDLDFHGAKLNTPTYRVVGRRRLEAHVLPISGLQILKVICFAEV